MNRTGPNHASSAAPPPLIVNLQLDATEAAVRDALAASQRLLQDAIGTNEACSSAQIVLAEALNNVVEHAYRDIEKGQILIEITLGSNKANFEIRDRGRPMPEGPLPGAAMPEFSPDDIDRLPEGGFGWALVRQLTSALEYRREGKENVLQFEIASR